MQPVATSPDAAPPGPGRVHAIKEFFHRNPAAYSAVGLVLLCAVMSVASDRFLTTGNLSNVLRQVSITAILAAGMTVVILSGGIDLSVGAVMTLAMTTAAGAMLGGAPIPLAVAMAVAAGVLCGAVNGFLIAYVGLPAFIVTLAMMQVPRGLVLLYTDAKPQGGLPADFELWGRGELFGVPSPVVVMLSVYAAAYVMMNRYPVGRYLYGIGGNEEAVRLSGIRVRAYRLLAYMLSGLTAGIAGVVLSSRLMTGDPNAGQGAELDAIAAVVLGGTLITGGRGHVLGTLIGALTLGVLNNGLNLSPVSTYAQKVVQGVVIVLAIYVGRSRRSDR